MMLTQSTNWKLLSSVSHLFIIFLSSLHDQHYVTARIVSLNNSDDAIRLLHDFVDSFDYRVRPILNQSQPIEVFVEVNLVNLLEIDEVNQEISINIWVNYTWWDEIRTWNPDDYCGMTVMHPSPADIWRPQTVLINSAGERDIFQHITSPLSIYSTGKTHWFPGGTHKFVCGMDLTYFPFDQQTCTASIMSTNLGPEIVFVTTSSEMGLRNYLVNGEWKLQSSEIRAPHLTSGSEESFDFLMVKLTFKRRPTFYIVNIMVPIMCLSVLSLFGFVVPKDSGERASFAITVLLSLSVFMGTVSGLLPANSDTFPLLTVYVFCLLSLSMFSVIIIVCQLRMGRTCATESDECKNTKESLQGKICTNNDECNVNKIHMENYPKNIPDENMTKFCYLVSGKTNRIFPQNKNPDYAKEGKDIENKSSVDALAGKDRDGYDDKIDSRNTRRTATVVSRDSSSLEKWRKWIIEHDDSTLFMIFAILWLIFTLIFVSQIAASDS